MINRSRPQGSALAALRGKKSKNCTLLARASTLLLFLVRLRQVNIPRHASSGVRPRRGPRRAGLGRRRLGLLLAPQRRRVDDARDDVAERLCHAYGGLCGRLDEQAARALGE